jgi:hypothetical protein
LRIHYLKIEKINLQGICRQRYITEKDNLKQVNISGNNFKFSLTEGADEFLFYYDIKFEEELPHDSKYLRKKIFNTIDDDIKNNMGTFQFNNTHLISRK